MVLLVHDDDDVVVAGTCQQVFRSLYVLSFDAVGSSNVAMWC
jgi:hypothetical protein